MPTNDQLFIELWISLASLLRSYTAAHGLNKNTQATVELGEERITVRHGDAWLDLERDGSRIHWKRQDGCEGKLELTEAGRLRFVNPGHQSQELGHRLKTNEAEHEEEMDMAAEAWARELMA